MSEKITERQKAVLYLPSVFGSIFALLVWKMDYLVASKFIAKRDILIFELMPYLIGAIGFVILSFYLFVWLFQKKWKLVMLAVLCLSIFLGATTFGIHQHAAIFIAT